MAIISRGAWQGADSRYGFCNPRFCCVFLFSIDILFQSNKNMLSQESQKMCFECSVAIKCELLKNFKNLKFEHLKFKH